MFSKFATAHYGISLQYDQLASWAPRAVKYIKEHIGKYVPVFIFSGFSGTGQGTALAMEYYKTYGKDFGAIYIRKANEISHSFNKSDTCTLNNIENKRIIFVFVDDIIDLGHTRRYCLKEAIKIIQKDRIKYNQIKFLQVLKDDAWTNYSKFSTENFKLILEQDDGV